MAGEGPERDVQAHIALVARRTNSDIRVLTEALHGRSWPDGGSDSTKPAARIWLRYWRPGGPTPPLQHCGCTTGRCLVCN